MLTRRSVFLNLVALAASCLISLSVSGAPVATISGSTNTGSTASLNTFTFSNGTSDLIDTLNANLGTFSPTSMTNFVLAPLGGGNYSVNNVTKTVAGLGGGSSATFTLFNLTASVTNNGQTLTISGNEVLASNTSGFDFSRFGPQSLFKLTSQLTQGSFLTAFAGQGNLVNLSSSFTQTGVPVNQDVPEPASMLVWGSVAVAGYVLRRRRS